MAFWGRDYDRDYRGRYRYDEGYLSRWHTDNGDPYADRLTDAPMRMIRSDYEGPERDDRGYSRGCDAGWY